MIYVQRFHLIFFSHLVWIDRNTEALCEKDQLHQLAEYQDESFYFIEGDKCCGDMSKNITWTIELINVFEEALEKSLPGHCVWLPLLFKDGAFRWQTGEVATVERFKPAIILWSSLSRWTNVNTCIFMCPPRWQWDKSDCLEKANYGVICKPKKKRDSPSEPSRAQRREGNKAFKNLLSDVYIPGTPTFTTRSSTSIQCVRLYSRNPEGCVLVNYNIVDKECRIFNSNEMLSLTQPKNGWSVWVEI